jgi:hypothetical protein
MTYYQLNKPSPPKTRRKIGETSRAKVSTNMKVREDE